MRVFFLAGSPSESNGLRVCVGGKKGVCTNHSKPVKVKVGVVNSHDIDPFAPVVAGTLLGHQGELLLRSRWKCFQDKSSTSCRKKPWLSLHFQGPK